MNRIGLKISCVSLLIASGCAFRKDPIGESIQKGRDEVAREFRDSNIIKESDITVEFVPQKEINHYKAVLSWPAGRDLLVETTTGNSWDSKATYSGLQTKQIEVDCHNPSQNHKVSFKFLIPKYGMQLNGFTKEFSCPYDFQVAGDGDVLPKDLNGRLFLGRGSVLKLSGSIKKLRITGIIADGRATIRLNDPARAMVKSNNNDETPPDIIAALATPTVPLDKPILKLKMISGNIRFELNGVNGENGKDGAQLPRLPQGQKGEDGRTRSMVKGRGDASQEIQFCERQPGNGQNGADATASGKSGDDGTHGTPSPGLRLEVADIAPGTRIEIVTRPGVGGKKGKGSPAQLGGLGGSPGMWPGGHCVEAKPGQEGKSLGKPGADGRDGPNGRCEPIELSQNLRGLVFSGDGDQCFKEAGFLNWF